MTGAGTGIYYEVELLGEFRSVTRTITIATTKR